MTRSAHRQSRSTSYLRRSLTTAVLAGAAGTALLAGVAAPASATEPTSAAGGDLGDLEKSLVLVGIDWAGYVQYPTEAGGLAWSPEVDVQMFCTGWFASTEGDIVTAGHCLDPEEVKSRILHAFLADNDALDLEATAADWPVEGLKNDQPDRTSVQVVQSAAVADAVIEDPITVQVVDFLPLADGDLALLKANGLAEPTTPLTVATQTPSIGDAVTSIGYPASVMSVSDVSRLRASFKSGTVSSAQVSENGVPGLEINADISGGMSGGPTVDASGSVVGVNSYGIVGEEQDFNFITDSAALGSFLDQHGVEMAAAPAGRDTLPVDAARSGTSLTKASADSGVPLWQFLAGGAVLLVGAGGAYRLTRRSPAAAFQPAASGPADGTRLISRPVFAGAPGPACTHTDNPRGARFCSGCGSQLTD